ncbi:murein transglycosylase A [Aurantiacibacter gangjinensis]|uniref:peptidoglycan lytic exotransglycosylase n=1 Tax=Aurantiacibacter gangjinensis TaxID=502682 RepID=A0A0G9MK99_9SPHN|nr:MltA domain-containing protein [Aurantiacibacter gangjinensis]APE29272.1 Membrane-bound lytic murein transglycosylase A precursor [Aurantiacibacter gangjinensis]KLE31126.1 MltA [Aurantiacibacter gangjinensis]
MTKARFLSLILAGSLAACGPIIPQGSAPAPVVPPAATGATAALLGAALAPSVDLQAFGNAELAADFDAFLLSCPVATSREDVSGLTRPADWEAPCNAAAGWPRERAAEFFNTQFTPVRVGSGEAFATGYFEPEIAGSRTRRFTSDLPVYGMPADLERCWREDIAESERTGRAPLSRRLPDGRCVEYDTRAEIEDGSLEGRAPVIGYAADPIEFFFLQIQGSGRLADANGEVLRIGYAGQNGHGYTGIGRVMRERGLIGDGTPYATSMQGIIAFLRDHPEQGRAIMRENESWVFFRELTGEGPIGSIGVPVRARQAVAVDPKYVPYGAPVILDLDRDIADGLWIAQDTGGAIRGANRFDTFWGAGADAREIAGGMSSRGQAVVLLPVAAAARLSR